MADVSAKIMGQFADNLATMLTEDGDSAAESLESNGSEATDEGGSEPTAADPTSETTGPRLIDSPEPEAVDLLDAAGPSVLKRVAPIVVVVVVLLILRRLLAKR